MDIFIYVGHNETHHITEAQKAKTTSKMHNTNYFPDFYMVFMQIANHMIFQCLLVYAAFTLYFHTQFETLYVVAVCCINEMYPLLCSTEENLKQKKE